MPTAHVPTGRGRPRDPALDGRVLSAALEEYAHTGWAAFTMDGVARRAGVGKSTLYRRWPTKEQLLLDAIEMQTAPIIPPDTGSFRADAEALATLLLEHFLNPDGWATLRITVDAIISTSDPTGFHQQLYERIVRMHREPAGRMVQRAIDRGDLVADTPIAPVVESLFGGVFMHALGMAPGDRPRAKANSGSEVGPAVDLLLRAYGS
ncbi:TetR/AcrR family transcriptional regulator [Cryptosporangium aurantiacum]|uniref:Transcriptional regulator, TetR family n=1 Tax=Cryptosporangium aurantiacum TaxID=134849 RepID=A0A1M7PJR7_9ACTN|nr:TetR/AcrR family transcriptional regulator [Cryptosporangium aurantiacum]SHN17459.1 transcriptional regulator, TetR family [Cryptosporangium aurantiacum]